MNLNESSVYSMFNDCTDVNCNDSFIVDTDLTKNPIYFSRKKIEENRQKIEKMIQELPEDAKRKGISFEKCSYNRYSEIWTNSECARKKIILLGIAINKMDIDMTDEGRLFKLL